jgi:ATP-dependent helicase YprA (DUF1998 family)
MPSIRSDGSCTSECGTLTESEILAVVKQLIGDPQILASFLELIDLREASSTAITADDLRQIVSSDLGFVSRRAFVTRDTLTYGFARMFESFRAINQAPEQIAVLENLEEAEAWLT